MKKRQLKENFEFELSQKNHTSKLDQIRSRKSTFPLLQKPNKHYFSQKIVPLKQFQKERAMENLQLLKRLVQVRFKDAEIKKCWSSKAIKKSSERKPKKTKEQSFKERERQAQNIRLGKTIQSIGLRKMLTLKK